MDEPTTPAPKRKRNARDGKPPAYQRYPSDFLADERTWCMTTTQVGAYSLLLDFHWREGSIPADMDRIAKLTRLHGIAFKRVWSGVLPECFEPHPEKPGRLIQSRMFEDMRSLQEWHDQQRENGSTGGRKSASLRTPSQASLKRGSTSSSASSSSSAVGGGAGEGSRDELPRQTEALPVGATGRPRRRRSGPLPGEPDAFTRFYAAYPRKVDRDLALAAWKQLAPDPELAEKIIASIEDWRLSDTWKEGAIIYPERFLKRRRWESIPPSGPVIEIDYFEKERRRKAALNAPVPAKEEITP